MRNIIFFLNLYLVFVSSKCQNDQRSSLVQLKNTLVFNSSLSTKLVSWNVNTTIDCCTWEGVTCSSTTGQLIGLDLSNESISGGINDSSVLFTFQNLQNLSLAGNKFNFTPIPSRFGNLTSLIYLNLSNSDFSGQIPGEMSQMTKLEILDVSSIYWYKGNRSLKLEKPNLTMFIQNLTRLTDLYLDSVNISAYGSDWCQALSSYLPNLKVLSLSKCSLFGPIDGSLEKLQSLSMIRLAQNNLSTHVPDFFANFKNLTVLNLGACSLNGTFPEKVLELPSLRMLDLSENVNLFGSLPNFSVNGSLCSLVLSKTNFSGELPESIGSLNMLSRLELPQSSFMGRIPETIKNLTQLSYLDLSYNNFSGQIPSFQMSKNLTHIDLSQNGLSGLIPATHFEGLHSLVLVNLRLNAFYGRIPSSLYSLPLVQRIFLSNNNFNGTLAEFYNASASLLDTLDLSSNKLEGKIPRSFFKLRRLTVLLLSSNNLSGTILTESFLDLANLTTLDLSYNNLSIEVRDVSSFPQLTTLKLAKCNLDKFPNLKNQSRLTTLDLSDNKIGGEIPSWLWSVSHGALNLSHNKLTGLEKPCVIQDVTILDLHSNRLSGVIPIPPQTATYVDYSDNLFSSLIPDSIGNNLNFSYFFSVSNNKLTGPIPDTICNATYLQVLDLSNNNLYGTIPRCLIEWNAGLEVLNLGKNNLSGNISGILPTRCALNTLDLHDNSLQGKIPQSIVNCTNLEVLNLGNNKIEGTYPCSLRNNTNLRVLVLRSNKLHGGVHCGPGHNKWEKLQILDIAFNDFSGDVPEDCFRNWEAMKEDRAESGKKHLRVQVLQFNQVYYQDTVTVTIKGYELELVKILTIFTSIDISNNHFRGGIPSNIGRLNALYFLNASHNEFTGSIPPSIGDLIQLESLDMSGNKLTGEIPLELTRLPFLSTFDLSNNQLEGRIPTGPQFQTFTNDSYKGNRELCGDPLTTRCINGSSVPKTRPNYEESENNYDWQSIFPGAGFGVGSALVLLPLVFCKKGRDLWDKYPEKLLVIICLSFGIRYSPKEEEVDENESEVSTENSDESDHELEGKEFQGSYCVFCTKLDFSRKQVIHDPNCTCFDSKHVLSNSFSVSSSSTIESPLFIL